GRNNGVNAVVTGYPGTEVFLRSDYHPSYSWKVQTGDRKKVIWAPHHTVDNGIDGSTFLLRCDDMLELADKYRDKIQFVFKPHPLLKFKLQLLWGSEKTEEYYGRWASGENTQLEESSYVDLFLTSDAMIHDSGSFTTEYLFTKKPVMYLTDEKNAGRRFGPFGIKSYECHYHGASRQSVDDFLSNVVLGGDDPMKSRRQDFFEKYLQPIEGMLPSERIICEIEKLINS
ncbi:MAG: CDP-glycerol glycerophosphotransferase family protein, partial [Bacteroidales bacterium]|nr:CDP-glycerol glycerophosphotransferase family protein [Bacteroidales bacterium]